MLSRLLSALLFLLVLLLSIPNAWCQERAYTIDPQASTVWARVNKDGLFSLLAHDHVIAADGFAGRISMNPARVAESSLQITIPVASMLVDPPELRAKLGLDGELDEDDRAEILENIQHPEQLDAEANPRIVATLEGASGTLPNLLLSLRVRIRQAERVLSVPALVIVSDESLRATGTFTLLQSNFGIEPYSALLGSIAVEDLVQVQFDIVATADAR